MTDGSHDGFDDGVSLPAWTLAALRAPLDVDPVHTARGKARVMALVRAAPRHRHSLAAVRPRWARRRGTFTPLCSVALVSLVAAAAGYARFAPGPAGAARAATADRSATVLGDTVVARLSDGSRALRDTLLDTLWVVRFVFRDSTARQVAVAGDLNAWSRSATPLARAGMTRGGASARTWATTVVVPRDAVRYAFVVDGRPVGRAATIAPDPQGARPTPRRVGDST